MAEFRCRSFESEIGALVEVFGRGGSHAVPGLLLYVVAIIVVV